MKVGDLVWLKIHYMCGPLLVKIISTGNLFKVRIKEDDFKSEFPYLYEGGDSSDQYVGKTDCWPLSALETLIHQTGPCLIDNYPYWSSHGQ